MRVNPVTTLTQVYRHAEGGGIAALCDDVRHGRDIQSDYGREVSLHLETDSETTAKTVLALYAKLIANGVKPVDIGLLSPFRKQPFHGVEPLNRSIRRLLGHDDAVRVGDLVMALNNDYDLDVMNGMRGEVAVVRSDLSFGVAFEDRIGLVNFPRDKRVSNSLDGPALELRWAFASTVHKAQGGQFPHVIAIVPTNGAYLFGKPALYTVFSRARVTLAVVGDIARISDISRRGGRERTTALAMLLDAPPPKPIKQIGAIDMSSSGFEPTEVDE